MKFVVARRGPCAGFYAAPGFVVAGEILFRTIGIREVADGHDRAWDLDEQFCGSFRAGEILAIRDVPRADENRSVVRCRSARRGVRVATPKRDHCDGGPYQS